MKTTVFLCFRVVVPLPRKVYKERKSSYVTGGTGGCHDTSGGKAVGQIHGSGWELTGQLATRASSHVTNDVGFLSLYTFLVLIPVGLSQFLELMVAVGHVDSRLQKKMNYLNPRNHSDQQ